MPAAVKVEHALGGGGTRYGDTWLPHEFTVTLSPIVKPELRVGIRLTITTTADGGPRCSEVALFSMDDDGDVPAAVLRGLRLEDWVERACAHAALTVDSEADDGSTAWSLPGPDQGRVVRGDVQRARRTARGTGYDDDFLHEVARVYSGGGKTPTKAVRESFGVAQSTAQLYVKRARDKGVLPPVTKGADKP